MGTRLDASHFRTLPFVSLLNRATSLSPGEEVDGADFLLTIHTASLANPLFRRTHPSDGESAGLRLGGQTTAGFPASFPGLGPHFPGASPLAAGLRLSKVGGI